MLALQVALDLISIEDALVVAELAHKAGANWLEVGTPLIKTHGIKAVRILREKFPEATIVADMKTIDTGDLEVELAAKNGADVVSILALASDETIVRAVRTAKAHGIKIMADLMNVEDKISRIKRLEELGVDYILIHTPIDIQKVRLKRVDASLLEIKRIKESTSLPIAAAGGITLETIPYLKEAGVSIFIVGRAITKAKDVFGTTKKFCETIGLKKVKIEEKISEEDIIKEFEKISTAIISDAMKRFNAMRGLKSLTNKRICGRAVTVRTLDGDWGKVVKAIDLAKKGDILVVDSQGSNLAVFGELATRTAIKRGIKGAIIDGAIRDIEAIKNLGFPIWFKNVSPNAGEPHGHGDINVPIACAGVVVRPGDYIVADELGVVVVEKERAVEILKKSMEIKKKEKLYKKAIEEGRTLSELFGL